MIINADEIEEGVLPVDRIICGDCKEVLKKLPAESIDIVITSPPYNVGKEYEQPMSEEEYTKFLIEVFKCLKRVLKTDGRICWNVPYQMMDPSREIFSPWYCSLYALKKAGLKYRDNITWNQLNSDNDTAWGSWCSASSPWLRHMTEAIILAYKDSWKKLSKGNSDITRDEFLKYVIDLWPMPVARREHGHPAPYPEELVYRCLKLFSYVGDIVLDPFAGSGTTGVVAKKLDRKFVLVDYIYEYCKISEKRIKAVPERLDKFINI